MKKKKCAKTHQSPAPKKLPNPRLRQKIRKLIRKFPETVKEQDDVAFELFTFLVQNPEECTLDGFCVAAKLPMTDLRLIAEKNSLFDKVLQLAHHVIAQRLFKGWKERKLETQFATNLLRIYSEDYRNMKNERYLLAQKAVSNSMGAPIQVVELENFVIEKEDDISAQA